MNNRTMLLPLKTMQLQVIRVPVKIKLLKGTGLLVLGPTRQERVQRPP